MKQCDGWPINDTCTNDARNWILGYEFCDTCARAFMPSDASSLRGDIATLHETLWHALALMRQGQHNTAQALLEEALREKAR